MAKAIQPPPKTEFAFSHAEQWGAACMVAVVWDCIVFAMIDASSDAIQAIGRFFGYAGLTLADKLMHGSLFTSGTPMLALLLNYVVDLLVIRVALAVFFWRMKERDDEK